VKENIEKNKWTSIGTQLDSIGSSQKSKGICFHCVI